MRMRTVALSLVVVAGLGLAVLVWPRSARPKARPQTLPTARVALASFDVTLRVPGSVDAAAAVPVIALVPQTQIAWIAEEGAAVKAGDVIVRLNSTQITKQLTDQEREAADAVQRERTGGEDAQRRVQTSKVAVQKAEQDLELTQKQGAASVERAEAQLKYAEKETEVAEKEFQRKQRLFDEHLLPRSQLDDAKEQFRSQQFALETAQRDLDKGKREAAVNLQVKKLDVRKAELELQGAGSALRQTQEQNARSAAERGVRLGDVRQQVANTEIKAPAAGLLLLETTYDGEQHKMRAGDQVHEGRKIGSIIDPAHMIVQCDVGEADIARVRARQPGLVRVDALGGAVLHGEVASIDNISRERGIWEGGTAKRVFRVKLQLTDRDTRLRPGMSAAVEIVLSEAERELSVPADAVCRAGGKDVVYCRRGAAYTCVPVQVLRRSEMMASIKGAVRAGDEVARRVPPPALLTSAKGRAR